MTRTELIDKLSLKFPQLQLKDVDMSVRVIIDGISNALSHEDRAEIRGFGSFVLNYRPPRNGRNPKTGASVLVPAKFVPHFKAGKELRERVDIHVV
jgi:integration host factor subunit beta